MYIFLYYLFWMIITVILSKCGIDVTSLEYWIIVLSFIVILSLRMELFKKEMKEGEKHGV